MMQKVIEFLKSPALKSALFRLLKVAGIGAILALGESIPVVEAFLRAIIPDPMEPFLIPILLGVILGLIKLVKESNKQK